MKNCQGKCKAIAAQHLLLKKEVLKERHREARPRKIPIYSISKYCSVCTERFYFCDYDVCLCCNTKLRGRGKLKGNLMFIAEMKEKLAQMLQPALFF